MTITEEEVVRRVLVFRLENRLFALPCDVVLEIVPLPHLLHPPGMPPVIEGFLNLRGGLVPVFRLHRLFDLGVHNPELESFLIVLQVDGQSMALLVDDVVDIFPLSNHSFLPVVDGHVFHGCVEAEVEIDRVGIPLFLPRKLLLEQERRCLEEFQLMAQLRLKTIKENNAWGSLCRL